MLMLKKAADDVLRLCGSADSAGRAKDSTCKGVKPTGPVISLSVFQPASAAAFG